MKILVAYDGSSCSDAALDDLKCAGLPDICDAVVISVAEVWLPPQSGNRNGDLSGIRFDPITEKSLKTQLENDQMVVAESSTLANHAKKRLLGMFPRWQVNAEATYGSPAWEILTKADEFNPDLIVVGSHGRSSISRFFLGSISQKVLTEAHSSVRIARGRIEVDPAPARLLIGFDGSKGAHAAVELVAGRKWPENSEIRLIAALEDLTPSAIGRFVPPIAQITEEVNLWERDWMTTLAESALKKLESESISATLHLHPGSPKSVLVEEAEQWHADCIFVGANASGGSFERFLLGSTSAAVAARAHCSVEVVRTAI